MFYKHCYTYINILYSQYNVPSFISLVLFIYSLINQFLKVISRMATPSTLALSSLRSFVAQRALMGTAAAVDSEMLRFRSPVLGHGEVCWRIFPLKLFQRKLARYGGRHNVTVLPGDGIGPEMIAHVEKIFNFSQV